MPVLLAQNKPATTLVHSDHNNCNSETALLPRTNGATATTTIATTSPPPSVEVVACLEPSVHPIPSVQVQRDDIWKLLRSRRAAPVLPGEALVLMDWEWWCEWCAHVQFLDTDHMDNCQTLLLECLAPGAVLPTWDEKGTNNDDDEDTSPGYIDNAALLLPPLDAVQRKKLDVVSTHTTYLFHWYQEYHQLPDERFTGSAKKTTAATATPTASSFLALRPGLVRGHHYELLHREVYHALRLWYGELTPPIVRRATAVFLDAKGDDASPQHPQHALKITLYPLFPRPGASLLSTSASSTSSSSLRGPCGSCAAPTGTTRCSQCQTVYYCDRECQARHWKIRHKAECKSPSEDASLKNSIHNNGDSITTRRRRGLNNVGNTCFLNSALQCLAHATPLTRLFLSGQFARDVETTSTTTTSATAIAYEQVVMELQHGRTASFSPTALKRAVAAVAPRFAGCHQHDAQEFLAYLLDGLHEDLNRVRRAPYVELPDFDGATHGHAVAGATAWEAHRRRNDSLVRDTFYGQFQSQCVCPHCHRVSVSFDAYNHVSLEIPTPPASSDVTLPVLLVRDRGRQPVRFGITVRRGSRVGDVRGALSHFAGVPEERLFLGEVSNNHELDSLYPPERPVVQLLQDTVVAYIAEPLEERVQPQHMGIGMDDDNTDGDNNKIPTLHVVATHKWKSVPSAASSEQLDDSNFGIPLFVALTNTKTCRDFWNGIWNMVWHNVEGGDGQGLQDADDALARRLLQIRLVTRNGEPIHLLKDENDDSVLAASDDATVWPDVEEKKESARTSNSIIPNDSDQLVTQLISPRLMEGIFFVHLEWTNPVSELSENEHATSYQPHINRERFVMFEDHSTWIEAEKKLRASIVGAKKGITLDQCFQAFTKPERLDEHNTWYCSKCKEHVRAMKTMQLWKLPNVLIVALKRFEFKNSLRRDKLDTMVDFPLDGLDMGNYYASRGLSPVVDDQVPAIYDCFGVVNHYGRMGFGHYTAFARHWDESGMSDEWALFDDSSVRPVLHAQSNVVTNAAYVMFYRRRTFH